MHLSQLSNWNVEGGYLGERVYFAWGSITNISLSRMQKCRSECIWEGGYISFGSISVILVSSECRNEGGNSES